MKGSNGSPILDFKSDNVYGLIEQELNLFNRIQDSFNYTFDSLKKLNNFEQISNDINLDKSNWREEKNYDWLAVEDKDVKLLIRKYNTHFTIYSQLEIATDFGYTKLTNSSFTYYIDDEKVERTDVDFYYDNPCFDLNSHLLEIVEFVRNDKVGSLWNSVSFERPKYVEVENIYSDRKIDSVDKLIFCSEELSYISLALFAETDMVDIISNLEVGDRLVLDGKSKGFKVEEILIDTDNLYRTGLTLVNENFNKSKFNDVYSLSRWYYDYLT